MYESIESVRGNSIQFNSSIKRGLDYYVEDGFELESYLLGAQKQILGGGRYVEGIGWAIGVDRLMLLHDKMELL
jgi:histidyl-tRNA synthetase